MGCPVLFQEVEQHCSVKLQSQAGEEAVESILSPQRPSLDGETNLQNSVASQPLSVEATLQKDAYLVFRALCKLSIRSSENTASTDVTVLRGKVSPLPCRPGPR